MLMCRELATKASEYLDDRLGAGERLSIKMHLLMCRRCRAFVGQLRNSITLMEAHSSQRLAPAYAERLDHEIQRALANASGDNPG
ncbi:zf-HC2 domain-containing protein [Marinobacter sp. SS21]|uniref:zf-HC2 domain-containing protein n=1 Tax=Marinobacter sp. SS21 TaxID=2979460 RepID=UPI00233007AF|nr:zf-HC2 domain-containing protein [Marinobacter sp. SS21]MDC0661088.1 zf-HC2 domain-containing protein [Marinobacter sp. SS21]